jgi:hypothetical protein
MTKQTKPDATQKRFVLIERYGGSSSSWSKDQSEEANNYVQATSNHTKTSKSYRQVEIYFFWGTDYLFKFIPVDSAPSRSSDGLFLSLPWRPA